MRDRYINKNTPAGLFCPIYYMAAICGTYLSEVFHLMDNDLKQYLEWLNDNLQATVKHQALIYCELKKIEDKIKQEPKA